MDVNQGVIHSARNMSVSSRPPDPGPGSSMSAIPWLLPVLVAVSMVIFLVISFSLHHKRFLQQRRRTCQYYVLSYHRVSGPMSSLAAAAHSHSSDQDREQSHTGSTVMPKAKKLVQKLRRFNTWSPQILKSRYPGKLDRKSKTVALRPARGREQVHVPVAETNPIGQKNTSLADFGDSQTSTPQTPTEGSGLLSVTDLSRVGRSNSCRGRLVVVTTSTGSLAVARKKVQISVPSPDSGDFLLDNTQANQRKPPTDSEQFFEDLEERVLQGDSCTSDSNGTVNSHTASLPDIQESRSSTENRSDQAAATHQRCPQSQSQLLLKLEPSNLQHVHCKSGSIGTVNSQCASLPEDQESVPATNMGGSKCNNETQQYAAYEPKVGNETETVIKEGNTVVNSGALAAIDPSQVISRLISSSSPAQQSVSFSAPSTSTTSRNVNDFQPSASLPNPPDDTSFERVFQLDCGNGTDGQISGWCWQYTGVGSDPLSAPTARQEVYRETVSAFIGSLTRMSDVVGQVKDLYQQGPQDRRLGAVQSQPPGTAFQCQRCQSIYQSIDSLTHSDLANIKELVDIMCTECKDKQQTRVRGSNVEVKERDSSQHPGHRSRRISRDKCLDSEDRGYLDGSLASLHDVVNFQS